MSTKAVGEYADSTISIFWCMHGRPWEHHVRRYYMVLFSHPEKSAAALANVFSAATG